MRLIDDNVIPDEREIPDDPMYYEYDDDDDEDQVVI